MARSSLLLVEQLSTLMRNMKEMVVRKQIILHYISLAQCEMNQHWMLHEDNDKTKY